MSANVLPDNVVILPVDKSMMSSLTKLKSLDNNSTILDRLNRVKKGDAAYLIARINGQPVGQIFLKFSGKESAPNYPDMEDAFVTEQYRGLGIGTKLITECEQISIRKGFTQIGLAVNPKLNHKAQSLYQKLGYKIVSNKPYLDGIYNGTEDWVVDMVKSLED